ncbi:hypothetical protein PWT90_07375 [Aphanocladium album]|nr:hypothetical protein PWT90_07375 [Aphanocladium album]
MAVADLNSNSSHSIMRFSLAHFAFGSCVYAVAASSSAEIGYWQPARGQQVRHLTIVYGSSVLTLFNSSSWNPCQLFFMESMGQKSSASWSLASARSMVLKITTSVDAESPGPGVSETTSILDRASPSPTAFVAASSPPSVVPSATSTPAASSNSAVASSVKADESNTGENPNATTSSGFIETTSSTATTSSSPTSAPLRKVNEVCSSLVLKSPYKSKFYCQYGENQIKGDLKYYIHNADGKLVVGRT